jgi:hypothetical protein
MSAGDPPLTKERLDSRSANTKSFAYDRRIDLNLAVFELDRRHHQLLFFAAHGGHPFGKLPSQPIVAIVMPTNGLNSSEA